ncbi:MAG: hypothetical protein JO086_17080, partial [Acidimicrobiia bacterium]|nr:hypothetical protein [Acidimicrobiia bacterium]
MRRLLFLLIPAVALAALAVTVTGPAGVAANPPAFSPPVQLPRWGGSEPSIAIDPNDANA